MGFTESADELDEAMSQESLETWLARPYQPIQRQNATVGTQENSSGSSEEHVEEVQPQPPVGSALEDDPHFINATQGQFRLEAKFFFLTWPQCDTPPRS